MGLLVGLPLKLFRILFLVLRVAWPVLLALLVWLVLRRVRNCRSEVRGSGGTSAGEPNFKGPVYTVDYEEVDEKTDKEG